MAGSPAGPAAPTPAAVRLVFDQGVGKVEKAVARDERERVAAIVAAVRCAALALRAKEDAELGDAAADHGLIVGG